MAKTTKDYITTCLAAIYNVLYIEMVKLMFFILKSEENLALKGRLSNAATITKQINAIQEGIALTMKSWEVRGVSNSIY